MLKKGLAILLGSLLIALGVNYFVIPNHLVDGGIMGIGLIAKYAFGVKPGLTIILISIPLYALAFFYSRTYFFNGIHGLLVSSFFIDWFQPLAAWEPAPMLVSALIGGVMIGTGIGVMLHSEISTGGTDLIALIVSNITKVNAGVFIFLMDCVILFSGWLIIPEVTFFHSALMVITIGVTTSMLLQYLR